MNKQHIKGISKFLSLILRHQPEKIQLQLDENGWADVEELLQKSVKRIKFSFEELEEVVTTNDKKRFAFNEDKSKIRANQGHSLKNVDLELSPVEPPPFLYHGTVQKFMENIKNDGLVKMSRQYVHLSEDRETANKVGSRRGKPVILSIRSAEMWNDRLLFYKSDNGVWLTDHVPPKFIEFKS